MNAQPEHDANPVLLNDDLYRELRMLVGRGLTPEQLRAHYRLNGAPEAFVQLVFKAASEALDEQQAPELQRTFWSFFRAGK